MEHWKHKFATYVYNHCNICNILIYLCNIHTKHLQIPMKHLKHMLTTCVFSATSTCCLDDWRLVHAELDAGAELDTAEWRASPVEKATPVEKEAGTMENAAAGRCPGGDEGWREVALERGGDEGRQPIRCSGMAVWSCWSTRGGEHRGGVVVLEHACGGADTTVVQ
jgi:hypothetical protein